MKKVVSGKELRDKMIEAINLLCDTVKQTLGPSGNNVIIDHSNFTPFITNDGVTIAQNIESDDPVLGSIIEIAKEASIKTNDNVGDGTTTTLVLVQSLINLSQPYLDRGVSSVVLMRKLKDTLDFILKRLEEIKFAVTPDVLKDIACISANDEQIGLFVNGVLKNGIDKSAITVRETIDNCLEVKYINGYLVSITHASEYYFKDSNRYEFCNAYILIINDIMQDIDSISSILNEVILNKKCLVIIAKEFDEYFVNEIMAMNLEKSITCFMVKLNEYGIKEYICEKDIEVITESRIVENTTNVSGSNVGIAKSIYIDKNNLRIDFVNNKKVNSYVSKIEDDLIEAEDFDREFYQKRKAMFTSGVAEINVGAPTRTESHERRMRLEDAICAVCSAKNGFLLGGGISLLKIAIEINNADEGRMIWRDALMQPFIQLMENAGLEYQDIYQQIKNSNYKVVYDIKKESFEDVDKTTIVDSYDVVRNSLINACSIASMLITTNSLVINEHQNNFNKSDEYTEI